MDHHDPTLLMDLIININHDDDQTNNNNLIVKRKRTKRHRPHSPISTFTIAPAHAAAEEDDEELDMANCLILLATGTCHNNLRSSDEAKFTSKILLESPAAGKAGIYVYQCKTCYRTFPSFQALGGHRTSHKKTKINGPGTGTELSDPDENEPAKFNTNTNTNTNKFTSLANNKVHECSICGAEFTSGQALGGHMRRHRVMLSARPINISQSPIPADPSPTGSGSGPGPILSLSLDLDLNLPAVSSESEVVRRQTALVLSTGPAMVVGCHY